MPRVLLFLFSLLAALPPLMSPSAAQMPPSPTAAAKLRRLLPFPDATLGPRMEINFGLGFSQEQGYHFSRQSSDYAAQIVAVRRQMTGGVADAAQYRHLGGLYLQAGLPIKSQATFVQSKLLYLAVLQKYPADGAALAGYGLTLKAAGQVAAAEAHLRKATQIAPDSADVWLALGSVLESEAAPKTEPEKHWERDAGKAYDKAVSLAPRSPVVWAMRGGFRTWGQEKPVSRDGLSDYTQAAALLPRDPDAQALVSTTDCFTFEIAHHIFTSLKAAKLEPADADYRAAKCLRRITAIAEATHGAQAAEAYTARAWVQFEFFYDPIGAQKSLRLALRQNPHQQDTIDYQIHVAAVTGDYVLWAAACRQELRRRPEVRFRILLANADYYLAQQKPKYWREGLTQMEIAHTAQPHDYACALGLAVFLLKTGQTPRANALLVKIAPQGQKRLKEQQAEYDLTRGVGAALAGQKQDAQAFFSLARKNDPKNQAASSLALLPN